MPAPSPSVEVTLEGPLDLASTLAPLARSGDDLLDHWDGVTLRRTLHRPGRPPLAIAATPLGGPDRPRLRVEAEDPADLAEAASLAGASVLTGHAALARLAERDPLVATLLRRHPGVAQVRHPDLLHALVRAISSQQVNLRWAATTRARLARRVGTLHRVGGGEVRSLDPERLAATPVADLRALQFTTRKAEYLVGVAAEVAAGRLDLETLRALPDAEVVARLVAVRGLGRWTAEWLLARTLGRPVVVAGDLGVRKVVALAYTGEPIADEAEVRTLTAHWGDAASAAQWLLLHAAAAGDDLAALGRSARAGGRGEDPADRAATTP